MAKNQKETPATKIVSNLEALKTASEQRSQIETLAGLTDNEAVKKFILSQNDRYAADIKYLRDNICYQAKKHGEGLKSVAAFEEFAIGLAKLVS